jgi:FKBP-type peptidyl-prolyl cis-trans isomerase SlpA
MGESPEVVVRGGRVRMHFELALEDGTVADSSLGAEPIEFRMGDGTLHPNLENAILGLPAGERRTLTIDPLHGFGFADPEAVHTLPRSEFPQDMTLDPGTIVSFTTPGGDDIPGIVKGVDGERITVDFSHPLAGHTLSFTVEILGLGPPEGPDADPE